MKHVAFSLIAMAVVVGTATPGAAQKAPRTVPRKSASAEQLQQLSSQIQELKDLVMHQQQRIDELSQQVQQRDQSSGQVQSAASEAQATATSAQKLATQNSESMAALNSQMAEVKSNLTSTVATVEADQKKLKDSIESPAAIHFKGITVTPGGYLAAETVYRSHGYLGDVNTGMNSIPFNAAGQSGLSEFFGSGRATRITLLLEGKLKNAKLSGYFETDWLGAGTTSNNNQTNSYMNRQRQLWGQVALDNGITITGGQMFSLLTETKKGTDNRTEALPMTVDPQYTAGFTFTRQFGLRVSKNFHNKIWLAFALENPQTLLTASGNASNFVVGGPGNAAGLYNPTANYSLNYTPDFILKAAFEPGFGHYEVFGIVSNFRDRVYPNATATTPSAAGAFNSKLTGGGIGANARVTLVKKVDLGLHVFGGNGVGRYGTSGLPDVTVRPDGTLSMLQSFQSLATLEVHTKRFDWYFNGGGEFVGKSWSLNSAARPVGYGSPLFNNTGCNTETVPTAGTGFAPGSPANCVGHTRNTIQGTAGFWFKPYNGPKGRIQFGPQYSYLVRNTWAGSGAQPTAIENMVFTSFRYYIP